MYTKLFINRTAKQLFAILLGFFPLFLLGQNQDSTKTNRKFSIGLTISPAIAYRSIYAIGDGEKNDFLVNYSIPLLDSLESPIVTHSFGLDFSYQINKHLTVESGVFYSKKGYEIDEIAMYDVGSGFTLITNGSVKYAYNYIDIPIKVNVYIISKKIKLFLSGGIVNGIFINQKSTISTNKNYEETFTTRKGFADFNLSIIGGIGVGYQLSKKITIQLQPQYQRFLNSLYKNYSGSSQMKEVLYSYGIDVSVYYQF